MTHQELMKLYGLKGRLEGRASCLESDINASDRLAQELETPEYKARFAGQAEILMNWSEYNTRLLNEIVQIIKEAEGDKEQDDLPF